MATAFLRALAARDPRDDIRGADVLAEAFLDEEHLGPLNDAQARQWVIRNKIATGAYEFMLARTAFFDEIVRLALQEAIPQIIFLGAGYDTRSYRFAGFIRDTRIFELDAAATQACKRERLQAKGIAIPTTLNFVPVNFETDDLAAALVDAGFDSLTTSLFVWEGVSYYLSARVVDETLAFVASHSPSGSSIAFDYASISADSLKDTGGRELRQHMQERHADEPARFGMPAGSIAEFLSPRGFDVRQHVSASDMKERYLAGSRHPELATPPLMFCLVLAEVR